MKNLITIVISLFAALSLSATEFPTDYDYQRLNVDFRGVAFNENSILCYGTGSIILRSTDRGKTWEQSCVLHDSLDIIRIRWIKDKYVGIAHKDFVFVSEDDGKSWRTTKIGDEEPLLDLAGDGYNIFVLKNNSFELFLQSNAKWFRSIKLDTANHFSEIIDCNRIIYAPVENGKLFTYDLLNANVDTVDFEALGFCQDCPKPRGLKTDGVNVILTVGSKLLKTSDDGKTWNQELEQAPSLYNIYDGVVYALQAEPYSFIDGADIVLFKSENYELKKITTPKHDRHTEFLSLIDFQYLNSEELIAVGYNKLISTSNNAGKNWELKSNFANGYINWINDKLGYSYEFSNLTVGGKVFKTTDGGITFLPQKFTDTDVSHFRLVQFYYFDSAGMCLLYMNQFSDDEKNLLISTDFGETYKSILVEDLNKWEHHGKTYIYKNDTSNFMFASHYSSFKGHLFFRKVYEFDKDLNYKGNTFIDDSITVIDVVDHGNGQLTGLIRDRKYPYNDTSPTTVADKDTNRLYYIAHSEDMGFTWIKDMEFYMKDTAISNLMYIDNEYYIHLNKGKDKRIRKLDFVNKTYTEIISDTVFMGLLYNIEGKTYLPNSEYFLCNDNLKENPTTWNRISTPDYNWKSNFSIFDDAIYCHPYKVKSKLTNALKFTKKTPSSVVNEPVVRTQFWANPPYPIPARNYVNTEIYWDLRHDINKADIAVYNLYGEKLEGKENITLYATDTYKGILSWDCSHAGAGIYFIRIIHGDATRAITVVLEK